MPLIAYKEHRFQAASLELIDKAQAILWEYYEQGYTLTLRQLYYQMVARTYLPNTMRAYKRFGKLLVDARMAGMIDWHALEDRTRALEGNSHWPSPTAILKAAQRAYQIDKWANQGFRIEVWIEKDALLGVIEGTCREHDVDYFSCRGYSSVSEVWKAAQRLKGYIIARQEPVILHLSDHDPSGLDIDRDLANRLETFLEWPIRVKRIALLRSQVDTYHLPPNPAKLTDSRIEGYIAEHGRSSWELDALDPAVINDLISMEILDLRDDLAWQEAVDVEHAHKVALADALEIESIGTVEDWTG